MKHLFFILIFLFIINYSYSQSLEEKSVFLEQLIEQISEETDEELDFTELYESLEYYYKHPININNCRKEDLEELHFLNSFQIEKLFQHIEKNGKLLSYLELQSVRGFDMQTIENLRSFSAISSI